MSKSFILVFSIEDKAKLEKQGAKFICRQYHDGQMAFLFEDNNKVNFVSNDIKYIKTNKLTF